MKAHITKAAPKSTASTVQPDSLGSILFNDPPALIGLTYLACLLMTGVFLGLIPAIIAKRKGYSFFLWWLFGGVAWIVATPCSILVANKRKRCIYCGLESPVARYCYRCVRYW